MRVALLTGLGLLLLAVGLVGALVPVLPTTPFVLLAAGCFGTSSPKLYRWLARSRYFGPFLDHYKTGAGVALRVKVQALSWLWAMLLLSVMVTRSVHLALFLALIGAGVTAHILMLKTQS